MIRPAWLVLGCILLAGRPASAAQRIDPSAFPAVSVDELAERHRTWLEQDVMWIITEAERDVFLRLPGDAQRDEFTERFWLNRDPTRGTERNEYRELHEERLAYADRIYGRETGRPGRLTDRGRMVVLLGEPRQVNRYPGSPVTVPVEVWSYAVDPILGVPAFFELVFFRDRGVGEYRLYSPLADGPERLLNPAGQNEATSNTANSISLRATRATAFSDLAGVLDVLETVDQLLADVSLSLIPGDPATIGMSPLRSEELLTGLEQVPDRIMPDATWASRMLVGSIDSEVRFETLPVEVVAAPLMDPAGLPYLHYAVRIPGQSINYGDYQDRYYGTYRLTVAVRDEQLRFPVAPEPRTVELELDADTTRLLRSTDVVHLGRLPLPSGSFSFDVTVENNVTRQFGRAELALRSPQAPPDTVTSSTPSLVQEYEALGDAYDAYGPHLPFQVGPYFMMPALSGPFTAGDTLWVFHQVYAPLDGDGTMRATYSIIDAAGNMVAHKASALDLADKDEHGVLNQLAGLPLTDVEPGSYRVRVDFDLDDRAPVELPLRVVAADAHTEPVPHANQYPPATDTEELMLRARQLRTLGRTDAAIVQLRRVLEREPRHSQAVDLQVELLSDAGRLDELAELLGARLIERPDDADKLLILAEVEARRGNDYDAIRYYERARLEGAPDTPELLNGLASAYLADGRQERARGLLEQSLQLQPAQPGVRALLQRLTQTPQ